MIRRKFGIAAGITTVFVVFGLITIFPLIFQEPSVRESREEIHRISASEPLTVTFTQWMDRRSVEKALAVSPNMDFSSKWTGNSLKITPREPLTPGTLVSLVVGTDTKNIFGKNIEKEMGVDFEITKPPEVIHIHPNEKLTGKDEIFVSFSEEMENTRNPASQKSFIISPHVEGQWRWLSPSIAVFTPKIGYAQSTTYSLEIPEGTRSLRNIGTERAQVFTLKTEPIRLISLENWHGKHNTPLVVTLSQPVDIESAKKRILISRNNEGEKEIRLRYVTDEGVEAPGKLEIIPTSGWKYDGKYAVTILHGIKGREGDLETNESMEISFETEQGLFITGPDLQKNIRGKHLNAVIRSTHKIDVNELVKNIASQPKLTLKISQVPESDTMYTLESVEETTEPVELTISKNLTFSDGNSYIGEDMVFPLVSPEENEWYEIATSKINGHKTICLYSKSPVDIKSVREKLTLVPPVEITSLSSENINDEKSECFRTQWRDKTATVITAKFQPNTKYQVAIEKDVTDMYGKSITSSLVREIETLAINKDDIKLEITSEAKDSLNTETHSREITVTSTNAEQIILQGCAIQPQLFIALDSQNQIDTWKPNEMACERYIEKEFEKISTWWEEKTFTTNILELFGETVSEGIYLVRASDTASGKSSTNILIPSTLSIVAKESKNGILTWILNTKSNAPEGGVKVQGFNLDGQKLFEGTTDTNGIYAKNSETPTHYIVATKESNMGLLHMNSDEIQTALQEESQHMISIITDKKNYNVGEMISMKGIIRSQNDGIYTIPKNTTITLSIRDPDELEIYQKKLSVIGGVFEDTIQLFQENPPGAYKIIACPFPFIRYCEGTEEYFTFTVGGFSPAAYSEKKEQEKQNTISDQQKEKRSITFDKETYLPNEQAKLRVYQDLAGPALVTIERGNIHFFQTFEANQGFNTIDVPVKTSYVPLVNTRIVSVNSNTITEKEIKLHVDTSSGLLPLKTLLEKTIYSSGEEIEIPIEIDLEKKQPLVTVLVGIKKYDTSTTNTTDLQGELFEKVFPKKCSSVTTSFTGTVTETRQEKCTTDENIATPTSGIFTGESKTVIFETKAPSQENSIAITAPEEEGKWELVLVAFTEDMQIGATSLIFETGQRTDVKVSGPDYLFENDEAEIEIGIKNTREENEKITVNIEADTLKILGKNELSEIISAGETERFTFSVVADEARNKKTERIKVTIVSEDTGEKRTMEKNISIYPTRKTLQAVTAGKLEYEKEITIPPVDKNDLDEISVALGQSPIAWIQSEMESLLAYTPRNVEELTSRTLAIAEIAKACQKEKVCNVPPLKNQAGEEISLEDIIQDSLNTIYDTQLQNGGWNVTRNGNSDPELSSLILSDLVHIRDLGYAVSKNTTSRAYAFITGELYAGKLQIDEEISVATTLSNINRYDIGLLWKLLQKQDSLDTDSKLLLLLAATKAGMTKEAKGMLANIISAHTYIPEWKSCSPR